MTPDQLKPAGTSRQFRIGVMGSASGRIPKRAYALAYRVGQEIARQKCIFVNGGTGGVPWEAAKGAKAAGGTTIGISPARDEFEHTDRYGKPMEFYDFIFYTNLGFAGRNHLNIFNSDGLIFLSGGAGTLNEFSLAYDENKVIGLLESSGGFSKNIRSLLRSLVHRTTAQIIHDTDPERLVRRVYRALQKRDLKANSSYYYHPEEHYH